MAQPEWESLAREVRDLASRVSHLEAIVGDGVAARQAPHTAAAEAHEPPRTAAAERAVPGAPQLLPILGRSLLGLAGAYLLRALTESGTLPARAGVFTGIVYAMLWLVWAARTPAGRRTETAVLSLTSVLVLSPLLWEAVLRFHAAGTWAAGAVLLGFTVFGLAISWRKDLLIVATIATLAGIGTAAALLMATYDVMPFTFVFLAIAAAVEASACLDRWLSERWVAAAAADLSVLLATWLVTNARGLPPAYVPIPHPALLASQAALLGIYLASTIVRTLLRGVRFTGFETLQCMAAFAIGVGGGLRLSNNATAIGALALGCAVACYLVAFAVLDRDRPHGRNFHTYSAFAMALALAGCLVLFSGAAAATLWSGLALACLWAGGHFGRLTLQVHGGMYLLLALAMSGALKQGWSFLLGVETWPGEHQAAIWLGLGLAAACYWLAARAPYTQHTPNFAAFRCAMAALLVWLAAGLAAGMLIAAYHAAFGTATHAYCATLRTSVLAGSALLAAWGGSRRGLADFPRLIYPLMLLGAYRLLTQDLHQERTPALVLSLLAYGAALMLLPRLYRSKMDRA